MGHGKDSLAGFIAEIAAAGGIAYDYSKFATDLRKAVEIITDIPAEQTTSDADKAKMLPERAYEYSDLCRRITDAVYYATEKMPEDETVRAIISVLVGVPPEDIAELDKVFRMSCAQHTQITIEVTLHLLPMTMGRFLQVLGTDCFRVHVDQNVWVDSFHRRRARGGNKPTLVSDTRFLNELSSVNTRGGVSIYISRPAYTGRNDGRTTAHASENSSDQFISGFDIHVTNDGSLDDLRTKAKAIWPQIKEIAYQRSKKPSN
jgi:hypothetical protein